MKLTQNIISLIENAEGKALATTSTGFPHVVPVSTVRVDEHKILLVNYFLGQTLKNIQESPEVSLVCWKGLDGFQIKAHVQYVTQGDIFDSMKKYVSEILPDRIVKGVLILSPHSVYDISATIEQPGIKVL